LQGHAYFAIEEGAAQLQRGMEGKLTAPSIDKDQFGSFYARVCDVIFFPVSEAEIAAAVKSSAVARFLAGQAAPIPLPLLLEEDPNPPSGLRWTSNKGSPVPLSAGTLFTASITVKEQRPISFVFPFIK